MKWRYNRISVSYRPSVRNWCTGCRDAWSWVCPEDVISVYRPAALRIMCTFECRKFINFFSVQQLTRRAGIAQPVRFTTGWMVRGSKPGGGRDFPYTSRQALGPTQPPAQWVSGLFPGGKAAGACRWPSTPSSSQLRERVELYFNPLWLSWLVVGWILPFYLYSIWHATEKHRVC